MPYNLKEPVLCCVAFRGLDWDQGDPGSLFGPAILFQPKPPHKLVILNIKYVAGEGEEELSVLKI